MPENTQRVSVGGFSFENKDEAEQAKKEIEGIRYIKTKTDMNDPEVILQVYNKMIGQKLFETAVGYSYLKDLQEYLTTIPFIKNEDILPIPVTHPRLEESLKKQKREIAQKERVRAVRARQREKNLAKIDRKALETESSWKIEDFPVCECNPCGVRCGNVCHGADERQSDNRGLSVETFKPLCILGAGTDGAGKGSERKRTGTWDPGGYRTDRFHRLAIKS